MTYEPTNEDFIMAAMESGFKTHELSPSMRDFANRIAYDARQKLRAELQADGWRHCAKGQNTTQFCGQLEAAVLAERQRQRDKIYAHIGRTTMSVYGTQPECKAARDALQRLLEDDK